MAEDQPSIDSILSSVPPLEPSPRPLILPTGTPQAATSGVTTRDVLSPTPPEECLSITNGGYIMQIKLITRFRHS